jgi:hypothetical protein
MAEFSFGRTTYEHDSVLRLMHVEVTKTVEVAPEVVSAARHAVEIVWGANMQDPASVELVFCGQVILNLADGRQVDVAASYGPETNTILIGMDTIRDQHPDGDLTGLAFLHAAHETRHKVQTLKGDRPPASSDTMAEGTYRDSRHEDEAWQSAIQAWAEWRPEMPISFTVGARTYSSQS